MQGPVTLGIRPEHIRVLAADEPPAPGHWPLFVEMVEILGAEHLIYGQLGGQGSERPVVVRTDESVPLPEIGSTLQLAPRTDRLHWFSAQDGRRIGD